MVVSKDTPAQLFSFDKEVPMYDKNNDVSPAYAFVVGGAIGLCAGIILCKIIVHFNLGVI